jgi:hypothetical protein
LRRPLSRVAGWFFSFAARQLKTPGASLALLPDAQLPRAELPDDLGWAASNRGIATAWASFAREIEREGEEALPAEVRLLAGNYVRQWLGDTVDAPERRIENVLDGLSAEHRRSGRLVLLTAFAPRLVDERVIKDFTDSARDPNDLLAAICWASFTAARRIGSWLWPAPAKQHIAPVPPQPQLCDAPATI